jgi:ubiquinone/menaquinone biosynthesis C-methylase UbiE
MMFKRRRETHEEDYFADADAVRRYAAQAEKSTLKYQAFMEICRSLDLGHRFLDVGAGPGVLTAIVATAYPEAETTALDQSDLMVEAGKGYIASKGLQDRIHFVQGDAADAALMASLGQFDFIYSTFTLHHWHDPETVIHHLRGALTAGGTIVLYDLRRAWWLYWIPSQRGFFRSVRAAYVHREVRDLLVNMGITSVEVRNVVPFLLAAIIH